MKAALKYPGLEQFIQEVQRAGASQGSVSAKSLHKAIEFAESNNEFQIRSLVIPDSEKDRMVHMEKIRLKEVEARITGLLEYLGLLQ